LAAPASWPLWHGAIGRPAELRLRVDISVRQWFAV
jgi:hypothetical protein